MFPYSDGTAHLASLDRLVVFGLLISSGVLQSANISRVNMRKPTKTRLKIIHRFTISGISRRYVCTRYLSGIQPRYYQHYLNMTFCFLPMWSDMFVLWRLEEQSNYIIEEKQCVLKPHLPES